LLRGRARRVSRFLQKNRKIQEKTAMRFQQGQSGNPAGRPRGALNRATVLAQELLSARVERIAGKLIELAEGGDMRAIRVCMERLMPAIKHQPIAVELPPIENATDSVKAVASIAAAVAAGELTATEAAELAKGNLEQYSLSAISALAERAVAALVPR
jgi:F0F1-type ATP synthase gamma subunit